MGCSHKTLTPPEPKIALYEFPVKKYSKLIEGGFSGLWFAGNDEMGIPTFWTLTDRGPNAEVIGNKRPFVQPTFNPHLVKFKLNTKTGIQYVEEIPLKLPDGKLMTGIPNFPAKAERTGDETPVTLKGAALNYDTFGIDPEGICFQEDSIWIAEEYGPSILKFSLEGKLLQRFVPQGYYRSGDLNLIRKQYGRGIIQQVLPKEIMTRKLNRGFEGIACNDGDVYAVLQSPLPSQKQEVSILKLDTSKKRVAQTITYSMDREDVDKIGDMTFFRGKLYLIEQNSKTGEDAFHKVFAIGPNQDRPQKTLILDLTKSGFDFADKVEGLAFDENGRMFVVNDNDFGLTGPIDEKTKEALTDSNRKSVLGVYEWPRIVD